MSYLSETLKSYQRVKISPYSENNPHFMNIWQLHLVNKKLKEAHNRYIEEILGITNSADPSDSNSDPQTATDPQVNSLATKKLYSLLKNSRMDSKGSAPLKQNGQLHTNTTDKANILNQQFQSVFTPKTPLILSQLSLMAIQDYVDDGLIHPSQIHSETLSPVPRMPNITISLNGILKLLNDLNPHKAAGPDELKPLILQRLREAIAQVLQVIYQKSLGTGRVL